MDIKRSRYDIFIEISCLLCLAGTIIYLAAVWKDIPDKIPGHYNAIGEVDRIVSKGSLIVLPVISWIMYAGMTAITRFPQIWNTGVSVTEENKEKVYRTLKDMMGTLKLLLIAVFAYLTINSAMAKPLPVLFLPVFLCIMFGILIYFIVRLVKVK
ncbi:MAG TPA: DUF1648 domain-containing protein [Clostridiales bacterium]|nr:DUF1648 domain-containing protein [Clostridiales bacterium]